MPCAKEQDYTPENLKQKFGSDFYANSFKKKELNGVTIIDYATSERRIKNKWGHGFVVAGIFVVSIAVFAAVGFAIGFAVGPALGVMCFASCIPTAIISMGIGLYLGMVIGSVIGGLSGLVVSSL
jgi:hypothetical protein